MNTTVELRTRTSVAWWVEPAMRLVEHIVLAGGKFAPDFAARFAAASLRQIVSRGMRLRMDGAYREASATDG